MPISPQEAIDNNDQGGLSLCITTSIEEAKWLALYSNISEIFTALFPDDAMPEAAFHEEPIIYLNDKIHAMIDPIQRAYPEIAEAIFNAANDHEIELREGLTLERRSHLTVINGGVTQMPEDPSGPVPG